MIGKDRAMAGWRAIMTGVRRALDYAREGNHEKVVEALRARGAVGGKN